ncbi:hypothetical protein L2729_19220 [Shewanella gelidimarina]|uniref:hypothetical protein n=1 Tax=Shewanella gelidimarina TaxID=56813 RepID=UPI00200E2F6B|nr:hypothetical protein [Shewanella gelidimarina]MCL1060105.1 hypothetical protein [Shewanella gelidimarina]
MNIKIIIALVSFIFISVSSDALGQNQGGGNVMVLNLVGTGNGELLKVPDIDGDGIEDDATCFAVDLYNGENGHLIGTAVDCLSMISSVGDGLALVGTTYFNFPQGTLITRGNTSVQPVTQPTVTPDGQSITHITGAASNENAILEGTGRFEGQTGTVRLSGMVDMSNIDIGQITFNCLFVIALDPSESE